MFRTKWTADWKSFQREEIGVQPLKLFLYRVWILESAARPSNLIFMLVQGMK